MRHAMEVPIITNCPATAGVTAATQRSRPRRTDDAKEGLQSCQQQGEDECEVAQLGEHVNYLRVFGWRRPGLRS